MCLYDRSASRIELPFVLKSTGTLPVLLASSSPIGVNRKYLLWWCAVVTKDDENGVDLIGSRTVSAPGCFDTGSLKSERLS